MNEESEHEHGCQQNRVRAAHRQIAHLAQHTRTPEPGPEGRTRTHAPARWYRARAPAEHAARRASAAASRHRETCASVLPSHLFINKGQLTSPEGPGSRAYHEVDVAVERRDVLGRRQRRQGRHQGRARRPHRRAGERAENARSWDKCRTQGV